MQKTFDQLADEWDKLVEECKTKLPEPSSFENNIIRLPVFTSKHSISPFLNEELPDYIPFEDCFVEFHKIRTPCGVKWILKRNY